MTQVTTGKSQPAAVPHVIVIGAGFAGLNAVKALGQGKFRVSLIDRNLYSTFQPLLYQVATGGLNPGDVSYAIGGYTRKHGARYRRGTVTSIDTAARRITLDDARSMANDYLTVYERLLAAGEQGHHPHPRLGLVPADVDRAEADDPEDIACTCRLNRSKN